MKGYLKKNDMAIFDTTEDRCQNCIKETGEFQLLECPLTKEHRRSYRQFAHSFDCFLCLSCKDARNKNVFMDRFNIFISSINLLSKISIATREHAEQIERDKYYKIVHNLRHLNAEALGAQYNFVPQEKLTENYRDIFQFVYDEIKHDTKGATLLILKQAKINAHIKTEFDTHELLSMDNPNLDVRNHRVREVILNIYHPFERDFKEKKVSLDFDPNIGYARFDYRTMRLALTHILSNAAKYVRPGTDIYVKFEITESATVISFDMTSIAIHEKEIESIFIDGVSGAIPKANNLHGSGLGMGLIKKAVELNNGIFLVLPGKTFTKKGGIYYAENKFVISLQKA